jgi:catechol 2,3-dioxygenase-like lactoylglutathione lyase family enzyme
MFRKIDGVVLIVENLDKCVKFYRDTLGLQVTFSDPVSFAFRMEDQDFLLLQLSAAAEQISETAVSLHKEAAHRMFLCVDVEDVDAAYNAITSKGVTFIRTPTSYPWGMRVAYFADPEGNLWEIRHPVAAEQ